MTRVNVAKYDDGTGELHCAFVSAQPHAFATQIVVCMH